MIIVGVTGNYGMGKSAVADLFRQLGAVGINTDDIVSELLKETDVILKIKNLFGDRVMQADSINDSINKKTLAEIVFNNPNLRVALEDILHPRVFKRVEEAIDRIGRDSSAVVIVEAPLIFERGYQDRFDRIITVFAPVDTAIRRLMKKGISGDEARKRIKSQLPIETKIKKSDFSIDNSGDLGDTMAQVKEIFSLLTQQGCG
ncbi:MAG: dephospho-CoA kinase [Nitrospirae bacterium]|nr:dephospho-CoA kinase [Nitrospirota bacterium]